MTSRRAFPRFWLPFATLAALAAPALLPAPAPGSTLVGPSPSERRIYRIFPSLLKDVHPLLSLGLDVAGTGADGSLDLILTPSERAAVEALGLTPLPVDLDTPDLRASAQSPLLNPNLGDYHTYAEAHAEMAAYAASYPGIARLDTIGFSLEGRAIEAVKISDFVSVEETEPEALVVGCHHARELMSVELPLYWMRRLLDGYGLDPVVTSLVDNREIWIVPILNPDGHVYVQGHSSGQSSGWWRKNRRPNGDGTIGVDLNRNYGYLWGWDNLGSSPIPSSETYRGTGAFSEPETSALRDFMAEHAFTIAASFHSYGELLLYPWGYDRLDTPDHRVFHAFGDSVSLQNGYRAGNPKSGAIYLTNGAMDDWVYGDVATKPRLFGFTFELNTADQGGFAPPDGLIGPTCELNWGPLLTLHRFADAPRRIIGPAQPAAPAFVTSAGSVHMAWSYPEPDPLNPPARHDVRRIGSLWIGTDDAESGTAAWDTLNFTWSNARRASGARSFWSGSGDGLTSVLRMKAGVDAALGESLAVMAFWDLESEFDYWYAEASTDGGWSWSTLPGNWTTTYDPFGKNEGDGVTGSSGGVFQRAAFSLGGVAGSQVHVRFRCVTDGTNSAEGLYLDDLVPAVVESGIVDTDTQSASPGFTITPVPASTTWFQARAVDPEGQHGIWSRRVRYEPGVTAVGTQLSTPPAADELLPNAPNPFNPRTEIRFTLGAGRPGPYRVAIHDARGRLVARLDGGWDEGSGATRKLLWNGVDDRGAEVGSGVYLIVLETVRGIRSKKITLLR